MGALTGVFAVFVSGILTFTMLYSSGKPVLQIFGIPVALVLLGIALTVPASTRRFGLPFLIAVGVGLILVAGTCVPFLVR